MYSLGQEQEIHQRYLVTRQQVEEVVLVRAEELLMGLENREVLVVEGGKILLVEQHLVLLEELLIQHLHRRDGVMLVEMVLLLVPLVDALAAAAARQLPEQTELFRHHHQLLTEEQEMEATDYNFL
jgi:hypothetical protein